jgi:hypothetical protein
MIDTWYIYSLTKEVDYQWKNLTYNAGTKKYKPMFLKIKLIKTTTENKDSILKAHFPSAKKNRYP